MIRRKVFWGISQKGGKTSVFGMAGNGVGEKGEGRERGGYDGARVRRERGRGWWRGGGESRVIDGQGWGRRGGRGMGWWWGRKA